MTLGCTLSACGGGGGSASSAPAAATPAKQAVALPIRIAWRGDSTNWGVCTAPQYAPTHRCVETPAMLLQADFDKALGAGVVVVDDQSAPGSTLKQDLTGTGYFAADKYGTGQPLATFLATSPDQILATNSQINDEGVSLDTSDEYRTDMQNWVTTVLAAGKTPIILEPNPIAPTALNAPGEDGSWVNALAYVAAENSVASTYGVTVAPLYQAFIHVPQWNLTRLGPDGVHPNQDGYLYKEQQYFPTLLALVKKMLGQ